MRVKIEPLYPALGRRIQVRRSQMRLTQEQLAAALYPPTTRASIANIEAGKQRVLAHTLLQIAFALEVPVAALLPDERTPAHSVPEAMLVTELEVKLGISSSAAQRLAAEVVLAQGTTS